MSQCRIPPLYKHISIRVIFVWPHSYYCSCFLSHETPSFYSSISFCPGKVSTFQPSYSRYSCPAQTSSGLAAQLNSTITEILNNHIPTKSKKFATRPFQAWYYSDTAGAGLTGVGDVPIYLCWWYSTSPPVYPRLSFHLSSNDFCLSFFCLFANSTLLKLHYYPSIISSVDKGKVVDLILL